MPKSEMPASVQKLKGKKYRQWDDVYHSARKRGFSKERSAKQAWGAVNKEGLSLKEFFFKENLEENLIHHLSDIEEAVSKAREALESGNMKEVVDNAVLIQNASMDLEQLVTGKEPEV